jgi:hypothetical protein
MEKGLREPLEYEILKLLMPWMARRRGGSITSKLSEYRDKRDPRQTPEPIPKADATPRVNDDLSNGADGTFVIQEHRARALHRDFRLKRDGVLVSWAIPKVSRSNLSRII